MEDHEIVALYHARDEGAIEASEKKYGKYCRRIALNILAVREESEECVNDTWLSAWRSMPPQAPVYLGAFLGRIVRNLSLDRLRRLRAKCRSSAGDVMLSELEECVPDPRSAGDTADAEQLAEHISSWLDGLSGEDRWFFVRRYWYGDGVAELARTVAWRPNRVSQRLFRLRGQLKAYLEERGVCI